MNHWHKVSDNAYDALHAIYGQHRAVFAASYAVGTLRKLCKAHGINPDM